MSSLKEHLPKCGLLFQEQTLAPVLCKPKLLPLKSVTLEKLEKMQKDAQEKMWKMEMEDAEAEKAAAATVTTQEDENQVQGDQEIQGGGQTDVWRADEDEEEGNNDENADL